MKTNELRLFNNIW